MHQSMPVQGTKFKNYLPIRFEGTRIDVQLAKFGENQPLGSWRKVVGFWRQKNSSERFAGVFPEILIFWTPK